MFKKLIIVSAALVFLLTLAISSPVFGGSLYSITDLGAIFPTGINDLGQIAGYSNDKSFLWENGNTVDIGSLDGGATYATGINNLGKIVGNSQVGYYSHPFMWEDGNMKDLGSLGGRFGTATAINDSCQIVGQSGLDIYGDFHAFLWENDTMEDLGHLLLASSTADGINENGQIVGDSFHPFLWENGSIKDLGFVEENHAGSAGDINNAGQAVGSYSSASNHTFHAFLWENGKMQDLGTLGGLKSFAKAINDAGQVVGLSDYDPDSISSRHAFL